MDEKTIEELSALIRGVYCKYRLEVHGKPYWTGGDYKKLDDEQTKKADRYMARFIVSRELAAAKRLAELEAKCKNLLQRNYDLVALLDLGASLTEKYYQFKDDRLIEWGRKARTSLVALAEQEPAAAPGTD